MKKVDIATRQIETAIDLFMQNHACPCSLTLAGAAEEMLGNILKNNNNSNVIIDLYDYHQNSYEEKITKFKEFTDIVNEARNECKHSRNNPNLNHDIEITPLDCIQMLQRALCNYKDVTGAATPKMQEFYNYWDKNQSTFQS